jgi:hypothetical protein
MRNGAQVIAVVGVGEQRPSDIKVVFCEFRRATSGAARVPGGGKACLGALPDQAALKFSQCTKHVKDKTTLRGRRIEGFGQAAKPDTSHPQVFDGFDQLLHRSGQPIELPNN